MKKQSGFTLIELMVVMAIIAILATAGLSAYGGYLKKARDSTRIADLRAIESVILSSLTVNGSAPNITTLQAAISAMNNNV
jgi:type IV pilus assembly protein PilA